MTQTVRRLRAPYVYACCVLGFLFGSPAFTQEGSQPGTPQSKQQSTHVQSAESNQNLVTLHLTNAPLRTVLQEIERQGKVRITYPDALVDRYTDIDIQVSNIAAESALTRVLSSTDLTYTQTAPKQIAIVRKGAEKKDSTSRESGSVKGRVLDSATQKGVRGALVTIVDVKRSTKTQADGTFQFEDLPAGRYTVAVKVLGYQAKQIGIDMQAGKISRATVLLQQTSTTLTEVVTTATGKQRSYEVGNDITRINVDEVRKYNDITSVADLLANRVPGMFLQSGGGDAGAGDRIRIRGAHSITLSNDPILIVDGVRYQTVGQNEVEGQQFPVTLSSRLNDIDPASIETIEVFKGPSAATLYGPDAVNGVIVITRKRGRANETRWTVNANTRLSGIPRPFAGTVTDWGRSLESNEPYPCSSYGVIMNLCIGGDSVTTYSLLDDDRFTTMGRGHNHDVGLSMQTGTNTMQMALNIRASDVLGPAKLSQAGVERLQRLKGSVPSWVRRPNMQQQLNGSANMTLQSLPRFELGVQVSTAHVDLRNSGNGIGSAQGLNNDSLSVLPEQEFLQRKEESTDQSTASVTVSTRQWARFNWSGTFGMTHGKSLRDDWRRAEDCLAVDCSNAEGTRMKSSQTTTSYTIDSWAGVQTRLSSWGGLRSTVGLNSFRSNQDFFSLKGWRMPFGVSDPTMAPVLDGVTQSTQNARAGAYLQEQLQVGNRLFLNGAVRRDVGSSLGQSAKTPTFPSVNLSWIAHETPLTIPLVGVLNTVRVRAAHGQSGQQPNVSDLYAGIDRGSAWYDGAGHPAYIYNSLGNSYIRPERSKELEFGVDLDFRGIIEALTVTYFHTITKDALVQNFVAIESGLPSRTQMQNIGKLRNSGVEATTSLRLIDNPVAMWTFDVQFSQTKNKVLSLGSYSKKASGADPTGVVEGYPLNGYWIRPVYGYEDRNHDGALAPDEYVIGDSMVYAGWNQPKYSMTYRTSIGLLRGNVRLSSSFSQRSGITKYTNSNDFISNVSTIGDLGGQLRSVNHSNQLQTVSSLAWNSADVTVQIPSQILQRLRARSGTFSTSATNLYLWTNYRGNDPNVGPVADVVDQGTTPEARNWTLRITLNY